MKQPIIENLEYLKETKEAIKEAIINKGVSVQDTDTFRSYAEKIDNIEPNNIEDLIIANPKVSAQSINPSSGYAGIKQVIINGVTSDIDENIKPENIKQGVTILDVTGNLNPKKIQDKVTVTPSTSQQSITPSEGYDGMSEVEVLAVDSNIDEDIKPENIKSGVNILGVDGTLEYDKLQEEITVSPMTVDQIIYPDDDYDAVKKIKVDKVTSEIDSNIIPENIKKDVSILGVLGELEESKGNIDIYKVSTIEEMNSLENIKEGDICLIYSGGVYPISADSVFNSLTYNNTVVLDSAVTDFYDCRFTLEDESQGNIFGDGNAFLNMSSFNASFFIDNGGNFIDINIRYMSNDGITYTLEEYSTKSPADLKYNFKIQDKDRFNDIFGKFLSAEDVSFSGIYQYVLDKDTNELSWKYLNIKTTGTSTNVFNPATFYTSNGMVTSEINRGDFRQSNIFIQSDEPETKNGLWIKLISKDGEEYNKVFNNSDIIGLISGPVDNDVNMFTKEDFPISIYANSSTNRLYQSYNCCVTKVLYKYNNSNKSYNAYMLFRNGYIYLFSYDEGKIQRINIETNEIEEIYKLTAHSDTSYQSNSDFNYNGVDSVYIIPYGNRVKGRIFRFNLNTFNMEELNTGQNDLVNIEYDHYIEAISYKNKIFYSYDDVFKVVDVDNNTATEIPLNHSMRSIRYIDFYNFYENNTIDIKYSNYDSSSVETYYIRLNLETNEVTDITENDFISNKFGVYMVYSDSYIYNFEHKKVYMFSETGNCGSKNMIYTNIDDDSLRYMMINYNEYSIRSNLVFIYNDAIYMIGGYTIMQTGTNYLYNKFKLNISDVDETYLDNKFTKLYLRLGNTSNKYNIFENIGVSIIDALYNRDFDESNYESYYRNNDVKELYYGDGTSWKLIKSHTDVS